MSISDFDDWFDSDKCPKGTDYDDALIGWKAAKGTHQSVSVGRKKLRKLVQACGSGDSYSGYSITEQELVEDLLPMLGVTICK